MCQSSHTCFGCRVDHPSKMQHDVCMLPTEVLTDLLFHVAVEHVNAVDIMRDWLCDKTVRSTHASQRVGKPTITVLVVWRVVR